MAIPKRLLKLVAQHAPQRFEQVSELTYMGALALSAHPTADSRLALYVRYFKAEQEDNKKEMESIVEVAKNNDSRTDYAQVLGLLQGRRLLQKSHVAGEEVTGWVNGCSHLYPRELLGYVYFLAGVAAAHASDRKLSVKFLDEAASEFHASRMYSRELQTVIQSSDSSLDEIRYLRSYALSDGDTKAYHIAGLSIAAAAKRMGDLDLTRHHARKSLRGFREEFLDPRRERMTETLLVQSEPQNQIFSKMELQLLRRLEKGPCPKRELLGEIYGSLGKYACGKSVDARFRTLLSRLNRKLGGQIRSFDGLYELGATKL